MPAKNTAVNIMILFTAPELSHLPPLQPYRHGGLGRCRQCRAGGAVCGRHLNILFLGIYHGYFTNTVYKVASSIPQVSPR